MNPGAVQKRMRLCCGLAALGADPLRHPNTIGCFLHPTRGPPLTATPLTQSRSHSMKAYLLERYGGPNTMRLGELAEPAARRGDVIVSVRAASVNPVDWKIRSGQLRLLSGRQFPRALGTDFAGIVHALGDDVTGWSSGEEVYGLTLTALGRPGSHAEWLAVPASALRRKPVTLSFEQATSLPVAGLTALNGLRLCGDIRGKAVLVNGATGGVGHFALQIAKAHGARVTAVCRAVHAGKAAELGADEVIDRQTRDFTREGTRYDVIYDAYGLLGFSAARSALTSNGIYVTPLGLPRVVGRSLLQNLFGRRRLRIGNVRSLPEDYAELERLVLSGAVRPLIEHVFALEQAAEAYRLSEAGGTVGKIVVRMGVPA